MQVQAQMPLWLKCQRISLFIYLATGILLLVYALAFISDVYIFYAYGNNALHDFYMVMQEINTGLLWKAVLAIIFSLVLLLLQLGKHPAGFFTLLIIFLIACASVFMAAQSFLMILQARQDYSVLDLNSLNRYIERGAIKYQYSTLTYDLGLAGYGLFLFASVFMLTVVMRNALKVKEAK